MVVGDVFLAVQGQWTCRFHRRQARQRRSQMSVKERRRRQGMKEAAESEARQPEACHSPSDGHGIKDDGWICDLQVK